MLNIYRNGAAALAAALTFAASTAQAEHHTVLIVQGSYFPSVVFAAEGDTIQFYNESNASHTVVGADETWTSGTIGANGSFTLEIDEDTPSTFSGTGGGFEEAFGEFVFVSLTETDS